MGALLDRYGKKTVIILHDLAMTALAAVAALMLRFEEPLLEDRLAYWPWLLPFLAVAGAVFGLLGLYRSKWRFASVPDLISITKAALALTGILLVADYVAVAENLYGGYFFGRQALIIYAMLQMALLGGPRLLYRSWKDSRAKSAPERRDAPPAFIVGRASEAEAILRAVEAGSIRNLRPVGILSPRPGDRDQTIRGVRVYGLPEELDEELEHARHRGLNVRRLVLTPGVLAPDHAPERVIDRARRAGLAVLRLQSLDATASGTLAPVEIEDLLLRPSQTGDATLIASLVKGRRVLITGGGGSIGSEICRRLVAFGAAHLLIVEHAEPALHAILEDLHRLGSATVIDGHLCDVRDRPRIQTVMGAFRPDLVFHAAALKHVPYLEQDWMEAIKTNVFGSINVAEAAMASGCRCFVMISTDKAIKPVSMLGATKRFAEMTTEALDRAASGGRLICVRFGNVLGSNGSVVPKFKAQIAMGGPVTVTHPDMIRYFMTVREACDLVLTAAAHATGDGQRTEVASVYVLKMGQPVKIATLAEQMIRLSGLEPGRDIEIVYTGMRPGERLHEILFDDDEPMVETGVDGIMAARTRIAKADEIARWTAALDKAVTSGDEAGAMAALNEAIPEFRRGGTPQPLPEASRALSSPVASRPA